MATQEFVFSGKVLRPLFPHGVRTFPVKLAPGTYACGSSIARQSTTGNGVAFTPGATDGSGVWGGFLHNDVVVDASGNAFFQSGTGAGVSSPYSVPQDTVVAFSNGTFHLNDVTTNASVATEVDTFTPANPTAGDVYTLTYVLHGVAGSVSYTVPTGGATAAAVSQALVNLYQATPAATNVGTAAVSGNNLTVTAATSNTAINVSGNVVGTGTLSKAVTTAAGGRTLADVQTGAPGARIEPSSGALMIP